MDDVLYLVHRLPYPPNKGDKVRSYHLLRHLAQRHRVHLGTFVDDPADLQHVDVLRELCASIHVERLHPLRARILSLRGLVFGQPLTVPYYRNRNLAAWVRGVIRERQPRAAIAFSSAMAQYIDDAPVQTKLVDLVDVDSAKWTQYSSDHGWPLSWAYRREGRTLAAFERSVVQGASRAFLVTQAEVDLFVRGAPDCAGRVEAIGNGVDANYFCPDLGFASPFAADEVPIVFTGAMDYWPNVDAAQWFVRDVLPLVSRAWPGVRFYIVGMRPSPEVLALAGDRVVVTGTVQDVRPYLAHARVVVAPLRIARGIQNKVLEAMAMGRPVVASAACAGGIEAQPGVDVEVAVDAGSFASRILDLLVDDARSQSLGRSARARVIEHYDWSVRLGAVDRFLDPTDDIANVTDDAASDTLPASLQGRRAFPLEPAGR